MSLWNDQELRALFLSSTPLIDVRAPIEFAEGQIPFSVNLPILNTEERAQIGTTYKEYGQAAAVELGHKLVSGSVKENRIKAWKDFLTSHPSAEIFCFRGGLRSQTTCQWLEEEGFKKTPIAGGYKRLRNFFLSVLNEAPVPNLVRIGGPTGSSKTKFLATVSPMIDLEELANHRGSAFGNRGPQPSQITFENQLALELLRHEGQRIIVEDESATIGKISLPSRFYIQLRQSPLYVIRLPFEARVQNIYEDYVANTTKEAFLGALERIQKSLGGVNYKMLKEEMTTAFERGMEFHHHANWIGLLLNLYYDPIYERDLKRHPELIRASGSPSEIKAALAL